MWILKLPLNPSNYLAATDPASKCDMRMDMNVGIYGYDALCGHIDA